MTLSRRGLGVLGALLFLGVGAFFLWGRTNSQRPRLSVVIIAIDTCRADAMGFLGGRFSDGRSPTPNLDALSKRAVGPTFGLAPVPLTLPAHVTMMSGLYPDATGVRENDSFQVPPEGPLRGYSLLAEDFRRGGYDTAGFVSGQPLERPCGLEAGFGLWSQPTRTLEVADELLLRERRAQETTDAALGYLAQRPENPLFLFVHYFDPHDPYLPTPETPKQDGLDAVARRRDLYLGEVALVDREIGRLLKAVPKNSVVLVVGDHGESLGEHGEETHGYLLHETTLRVPFLLVLPETIPKPPERIVPPRLIDVYPTLLQAARVPSSHRLPRQGESLLEPPSDAWCSRAETLYAYYQFGYAMLRSFRNRTHKMIEGGGRVQVFAWRDDPGETHDLSGDVDLVARLRQEHNYALARRTVLGRAHDRWVEPNAHAPYLGGRVPGLALEPTVQENAALPRVDARFDVIADLDRARDLIRRKEPGRAALLLAAHPEAERKSNPSLQFWLARAHQLVGRDQGLSAATRLLHLGQAEALFRVHWEQFRDPRSSDSGLRLLLDRYGVTGDPAPLEQVLVNTSGFATEGRKLPLLFRARALEHLGRVREALEVFESAQIRHPDDPRIQRDVQRLRTVLASLRESGGLSDGPPR